MSESTKEASLGEGVDVEGFRRARISTELTDECERRFVSI
jgi:hypothetical protein